MIRYSTGLRNALAGVNDLAKALANGKLYIYSGAQPTSADTGADAATVLLAFTENGLAYTAPVRASATLTLGGASGSVDTVTVGGSSENLLGAAVDFSGDLATTTDLVAAAINAYSNKMGITAVSDGASVVTLYGPYDLADECNGLTLAASGTTMTTSVTNFAGGVAPANGLNLTYPPVTGEISKDLETWMGTVLVSGNAGWFRFVAGGSSPNGTTTTDVRMDGLVSTSQDMIVTSTSLTKDLVEVFSTFRLTVPAS